jgi:hypothetical protein
MNTDKNGCSTCPAGQEQWQSFTHGVKTFVQYEFRHATTGELFTTCAETLEQCRSRKDIWVISKNRVEQEAEHHYFASHPELNP